jgi:hypothetical protein
MASPWNDVTMASRWNSGLSRVSDRRKEHDGRESRDISIDVDLIWNIPERDCRSLCRVTIILTAFSLLAPLPMVTSAMFVIMVTIEMVIAIIPGMAAVVITVVIVKTAPRGRETYNE